MGQLAGELDTDPGLQKHLWAICPSGRDVDTPSPCSEPLFRGKWGKLDCHSPYSPGKTGQSSKTAAGIILP